MPCAVLTTWARLKVYRPFFFLLLFIRKQTRATNIIYSLWHSLSRELKCKKRPKISYARLVSCLPLLLPFPREACLHPYWTSRGCCRCCCWCHWIYLQCSRQQISEVICLEIWTSHSHHKHRMLLVSPSPPPPIPASWLSRHRTDSIRFWMMKSVCI